MTDALTDRRVTDLLEQLAARTPTPGGGAVASVAAALGAAGWLFGRSFLLPFAPPSEMRIRAEDAIEATAFLSLGMRRAAADLEFVRLMQYYGTVEGEPEFDYLVEGGKYAVRAALYTTQQIDAVLAAHRRRA